MVSNSGSFLYASNKYRLLLKEYLKAEEYYFIAIDSSNNIRGVLPSFLKSNSNHGNVLNSLPFYGSNGAIIEFAGDFNIRKALLNAFYGLAKEKSCIASTIITSPFETDVNFYEKNSNYMFKDERIGQLTKLPGSNGLIADDLMAVYHQKTRNMIRKAVKNNVTHVVENTPEKLEFIINTHQDNMNKIGGVSKPRSFFNLLATFFNEGIDYKIYTAFLDDRPIAAVLLFYFNKVVEYFTPVISEEFREMQPLSFLIFEAMKDAVLHGYTWWNWGGTWLSQDGVYHFKKRWGTTDHPYYYYTNVYDPEILKYSKEKLLKEYPNFYVVPFGELK